MNAPKRLLLELPTADEIDDLAVTTPRLSVRKFEYDKKGSDADLDYTPCKGQVMLVVMGEKGVALVRKRKGEGWSLPAGPINTYEGVADAAKRVAKESCGLSLRSMELAAMYDVIWHYDTVTIKRLHIVYSGITDDTECGTPEGGEPAEALFREDVSEAMLEDELDRAAFNDCGNN